MENKENTGLSQSGKNISVDKYRVDMLLRQNKWLREKLEPDELLREFSKRKPSKFTGACMIFIGLFAIIDVVFHLTSLSPLFTVLTVIVGIFFLIYGYRFIALTKNEYVFTTDKRLVYHKIDLLGRPGDISVPITDISSARLYKNTIMFGQKESGDLILKLTGGKSLVISGIINGTYILESINH